MLIRSCIAFVIYIFFINKETFSQNSLDSSVIASAYFKTVVDNISSDYYFIDKIDLEQIINELKPLVNSARTIKETYPAIKKLLDNLYEKHSGFLTPAETFKLFNDTTEIVYPSGSLLHDSIGYIRIPPYISSEIKMVAWADTLQYKILALHNAYIKGWIIDLRDNYGGSHLPMIAGLAPILGEGLVLSETNKNGEKVDVYINNANLIEKRDSFIVYRFPRVAQPIKLSALPVALLINSKTASGGEITAIALKRCSNMKIFGESSAGYPTMNKVFLMPDHALLYIVNKLVKDAFGNTYLDKIIPDVIIPASNGNSDKLISDAIKWIFNNK